VTTRLINVSDYGEALLLPDVPSDLTANYNPPALLYETDLSAASLEYGSIKRTAE